MMSANVQVQCRLAMMERVAVAQTALSARRLEMVEMVENRNAKLVVMVLHRKTTNAFVLVLKPWACAPHVQAVPTSAVWPVLVAVMLLQTVQRVICKLVSVTHAPRLTNFNQIMNVSVP